jgi:hypothetical protein
VAVHPVAVAKQTAATDTLAIVQLKCAVRVDLEAASRGSRSIASFLCAACQSDLYKVGQSFCLRGFRDDARFEFLLERSDL